MSVPRDTAPAESGRPHGDGTARHVLVVGGGIAGLAAAHRLLAGGARVTLLEAATRLGGKLLTGEVAGCRVDLGAESLLARRPEAIDLARAVGLADALQPPAVLSSTVWTRGALRRLPRGHVMGVPGDPEELRGLLPDEAVARVAQEAELPPSEVGEDVAIGAYVAERMGREVVDRLVEPLLGGVYAGDAYRISLRAAVPPLYRAVREHGSLLAAVRALRAGGPAPDGPVFLGIDGGVGRLPLAVAEACRAAGARLETGVALRELRRATEGWRAVTEDGRTHRADAVVLAVPAPSAARLLAVEAPDAARALRTVEYASMALVTLAFRRADLAHQPPGSGFLVPPVEGRTIKASTFSAGKWAWVRDQDPNLLVLRTSVGRVGEEHLLEREDGELVAASLHDLRDAVGLAARPVASRVTRWQSGLPQYTVDHLSRTARVRDAAHRLPGLALCGAALDGVGVPACVASGRAAAERVLGDTAPGAGPRRPS